MKINSINSFNNEFILTEVRSTIIICVTFTPIPFTLVLLTYVRYYNYDMGESSFELCVPAWFVFNPNWNWIQFMIYEFYKNTTIWICSRYPFDWKTPTGYLTAFVVQFFGVITISRILLEIRIIIFITCWLFIFIAEDITEELDAFIIAVERSNEIHTDSIKRFHELVKIHSNAKE